jgi:hypothetical protein
MSFSLHKVPNGLAWCDRCEGSPSAASLRVDQIKDGRQQSENVCVHCVEPKDQNIRFGLGVTPQKLEEHFPMLTLMMHIEAKRVAAGGEPSEVARIAARGFGLDEEATA